MSLLRACEERNYPNIWNCLQTENDVNRRTASGKTALMMLFNKPLTQRIAREVLAIIKLLFDSGVNLNAVDDKNESVLHKIVHIVKGTQNSNYVLLDIIKFLVSKRANTEIRNTAGKTCYDLAYYFGARRIGDELNMASLSQIGSCYMVPPSYEEATHSTCSMQVSEVNLFANATAPHCAVESDWYSFC